MLAPSPAPRLMMAPTIQHNYGPMATPDSGRRQFKKHKALPRPPSRHILDHEDLSSNEPKFDLALDAATIASSSSQDSSPTTDLRHQQSRRIANGPEPPPTPPAHSRTSSNSHSAIPSSPTIPDHHLSTPKNARAAPPATPPDQRSPPTPDVTPPQPESRPRALRPSLANRTVSRTTTFDSRTESFKTAREELVSSEEEDGKSTIRPPISSGRTSQQTVRKLSYHSDSRDPSPQVLSMALSQLDSHSENPYTPRTRGEFGKFDGAWDSSDESYHQRDDEQNRSVTVRLRNVTSTSTPSNRYRRGVVEDDDVKVTPSKATKAIRQLSLGQSKAGAGSPNRRKETAPRSTVPPAVDLAETPSKKRSSVASSRSVSSTIEAFLIDGPPARQRTLRHVRKQSELRNPIVPTTDRELPSSKRQEPDLPKPPAEPIARPERGRRHESYASNTTVSSIAGGKARREVWKSGGIPVVVVPDRRSSHRSTSREPSLRSTSSRRSKRTVSLGSDPVNGPLVRDWGPIVDRTNRRNRPLSYSDQSEWTIDFPPAIPTRSSSLSAPTSRNVSRAGSMTTDSIRDREAFRQYSTRQPEQEKGVVEATLASPLLPPPQIIASKPEQSEVAEPHHDGDRHDDSTSMKRFTARNTPFSIVSVETNGTAPELSEAMAIHMYPHQNSSLLMVNHSNKPSDASDLSQKEIEAYGQDMFKYTVQAASSGGVPVTPPQPQVPHFALEDVDSPLRNPRDPPEPPSLPSGQPPALAFIPATPSGVTPGPDVAIQMGNFYEAIAEEPPPQRRESLVKRAFSRRNRSTTEYPPNSSRTPRFLSRALSLSRRRKRRSQEFSDSPPYRTDFPQEGDEPPEGAKLHPFWRPQWLDDEYDDDEDWRHSRRSSDYEEDEHLRYPPVDNRPSRLQRSFSEKFKRTFAARSSLDEEDYPADDGTGPERRTIRRTPSGNLRVIRRLTSIESLQRRFSQPDRPFTAPEEDSRRSFWRGTSVHKRIRESSRRRRDSLGEQLEEIQNLPRRLSEKRREKRSRELRQQISGPTEVRDGVEDVIRSGYRRENGHANRI